MFRVEPARTTECIHGSVELVRFDYWNPILADGHENAKPTQYGKTAANELAERDERCRRCNLHDNVSLTGLVEHIDRPVQVDCRTV